MNEERRKALVRFAIIWLAIQVLYPIAVTVVALMTDQYLHSGWRMFARVPTP